MKKMYMSCGSPKSQVKKTKQLMGIVVMGGSVRPLGWSDL